MSRRQPFLNIRTEGALLPPDLLGRLTEGTNLPGLKPEDYHLGAGEKLNEAISRSWTRLLALWSGFRKAQSVLASSDLGTTLTREKWLLQLFQELGYGRLIAASPFEIDGKTYPISHLWHDQHYHVPIHLVSFRADLDKRSEQRIQGASKASPHGMVQEFLNRSKAHLWALVSNGLKLLILRDNASLTRQAYIEFDLEAIFAGESYADFRLLWLVCHQSRVEGTAQDRPETCWLEVWSKQAQTEGRRALEQLQGGVRKALETLGTGFIAHPANHRLRIRLQSGELQKHEVYRQLLRLVYRLIFLFVAEDRDLLHPPDASDEARSRYSRFYSGQRLRRMAERSRGGRHADLWIGMRLVFTKLGDDRGCLELGLPALGGFLFGPEAVTDLESAELSNEHLLQAIRNLGLVKDRSGWRLVDYRNLGSEELGSVYESLLELNPTMELDAGVFTLGTVAGNQRKTSGSYYTPDSLVQCLLDSALDPVVEQAVQGKTAAEAERAILALKVCDPAVGSGHFLVGAAHRLAGHLSRVRAQAQGESEPSPLFYQHALRDVIGRCLYGVDANPMAAELCRVSLWLEALEPGKPLSFLDHHIRVGNSLLGTTPALLAKGIPDEAFTPIEGDDKDICSRFKKVNKDEHKKQMRLFTQTTEPWEQLGNLAASMIRLDDAPDDSIAAIREKERMYEAMVRSGGYLDGRFCADTWCAAFVWKKTREFNYPITEEVFRRIEHNPHACDAWMRVEIERLSGQYQFFHWHLAFPDVFHVPSADQSADNNLMGWNGGFDVVLGNPPWERVKLQEQEFFASRNDAITSAPNAALRKKLIAALADTDPILWSDWCAAAREAEGQSNFVRLSGRYPFCGKGDVNTYTLFAEHNRNTLGPNGQAGFIVPTGIATDDTTKDFFRDLMIRKNLAAFYGFENEGKLFVGIDHRVNFCLLVLSNRETESPSFSAFIRDPTILREVDRVYQLTAADIESLNPNTRTCPVFRTRQDADLTLALYRRVGVLWREGDESGNPWDLRFTSMFHMSNDSGLFHSRAKLEAEGYLLVNRNFTSPDVVYLPLLEAKMVYHFNHRFGDFALLGPGENDHILPQASDLQLSNPNYFNSPRYWVERGQVLSRVPHLWQAEWLLGWRDVTDPRSSARTVIACIIPKTGVSGKLPFLVSSRRDLWLLYSNLCSFILDYAGRQKIGGVSLSMFVMKQLPILPPTAYASNAPWFPGMAIQDWVRSRVLELTYTAWDMGSFAQDCGWGGPPFLWDEERRFLLRCELDSAFFYLYFLTEGQGDRPSIEAGSAKELPRLKTRFPSTRDAVAYVMDTFPIVRRRDEENWGEYRTKRVVLEIYDAMIEAARTGIPYQTRLSPPPADISVAHPWPVQVTSAVPAAIDAVANLVAVQDEAWATPVDVAPENVALFALIDVLRRIGKPVDPQQVRIAAILVRRPVLATAFLNDTEASEWLRVIGPDARPMRRNVIQISQFQPGAVDHPWAEAIRLLKGSGGLVTDSSGKWSAGAALPQSSEQDWIAGRAAVAVQLLGEIAPAEAERKVIALIRSVEDGTARRAVS